jgi:hypothetical protein
MLIFLEEPATKEVLDPDIREYLEIIDERDLPPEFAKTYSRFKEVFESLYRTSERDRNFADDAFTYSSILTHRASLLEG